MDPDRERRVIAQALAELESSLERLTTALAHRNDWIRVDGAADERAARAEACLAYSTIDYAMDDAVGSSVVCMGVIGTSADVVKCARAVNSAKAAFKAACVRLQGVRMRVPVKGSDGKSKAIPVIRVVLRNIQRSDINLLAAYRKIPILDAPPRSITYTRARTRAVYRKSIEEIYNSLSNVDGPLASADRARLATLGRHETHLAITRPHYANVRANIVYSRLDSRGRGRVQLAAELPLMFSMGRNHMPPDVDFPAAVDESPALPGRKRRSEIQAEPFLQTIPAHRYL